MDAQEMKEELKKQAKEGITNIKLGIASIKDKLDLIEEDIIDQRERLLRIEGKMD